jgi:hypothetical protein
LPLILLNGIHQVILKTITAVARKDKARAAVKNYMNTFVIPYYDKNGSRSQNMLIDYQLPEQDKRRSYEQRSIE